MGETIFPDEVSIELFLMPEPCIMTKEQRVMYASAIIRVCLNLIEHSLTDEDDCVDLYLKDIEKCVEVLKSELTA